MKLLFIGPIKNFSGFATASRGLLRTLSISPEIDVVARAITYDQLDNEQQFQTPDWLTPLINKSIVDGVDMCLQVTTCNIEANPIPGVLNGLYTFFETDKLQPSWAAKAQSFDFIIVASRYNAETLLRSGITKPILVAAVPCDLDVYRKAYEPFEIKNANNRTIFYNICQLSTKKGIDILLRAYYAAFAAVPNDVLLVLKTYLNMQDRSKDLEIIKHYINSIKAKCRIPVQQLPPVLPLIQTMSENEIHQLHTRGDAYVNSSRSEGWCVPVFDALAHGKTVISHNSTGMSEFVSKDNSLLYGGTTSLFYDMPHPDPGLYTGLEQCFEPSVAELALVMQRFYLLKNGNNNGTLNDKNKQEWESVLTRRENAKQLGMRFDYRNVSGKIVEQLVSMYNMWKNNGVISFHESRE